MSKRKSRVALLTRHRWIGVPPLELWRCTSGVPFLYEGFDLECFGCGVQIAWSDIPTIDRYLDLANNPLRAEELAVRLDLWVGELQLKSQQLDVWGELKAVPR